MWLRLCFLASHIVTIVPTTVPFQLSPPHILNLEIFSKFKIIDYTFIYPSYILRHVYAAASAKQF